VLCTRAQVKTLVGLATADTASDAQIDLLAAAVSDRFAHEADRVANGAGCLELVTLTERFSIERSQRVLWLAARPVIDVDSLKEAVAGAFSAAAELVEDTDWQMVYAWGKLIRIGWWLPGDLTVQVTYSGGYVNAPAWVSGTAYVVGDCASYGAVPYAGSVYQCILAVSGTTVPSADPTHWTAKATFVPVPRELADAAAKQTAFYFRRMDKLGVSSEGAQGGSIQTYCQDDLLPEVKAIVARYRRAM